MNGLLAAQLSCNLILFGIVLCYFLASVRARRRGARPDERITAYLNVLEARATQLEAESARYRDRCENQIKVLTRICDQARTILERGRWHHSLYPTLEEEELKEAAQLPPAETQINPFSNLSNLNHLEKTKDRLRADSVMDLRSLLKDQLA